MNSTTVKLYGSGPSCIKQLKMTWEFLQPFPVFRRVFLHAIMDKSAEGTQEYTRNTMTVRKNPQENREQLQKFPLNLKFLYATGPKSANPSLKYDIVKDAFVNEVIFISSLSFQND